MHTYIVENISFLYLLRYECRIEQVSTVKVLIMFQI